MADLSEVFADLERHIAGIEFAQDRRTRTKLVEWLRARAARYPEAEAKALLKAAEDIELGDWTRD